MTRSHKTVSDWHDVALCCSSATTPHSWFHFVHPDIRRMLEMESERDSKEHGWELVSKKDNVEVLKKEVPGSPVNLVKVTQTKHPFCYNCGGCTN